MPQELKVLFTILCTACRFRAPVCVGNKRQWNCPHRRAAVMEMNDDRTLTFQMGNHVTTV